MATAPFLLLIVAAAPRFDAAVPAVLALTAPVVDAAFSGSDTASEEQSQDKKKAPAKALSRPKSAKPRFLLAAPASAPSIDDVEAPPPADRQEPKSSRGPPQS